MKTVVMAVENSVTKRHCNNDHMSVVMTGGSDLFFTHRLPGPVSAPHQTAEQPRPVKEKRKVGDRSPSPPTLYGARVTPPTFRGYPGGFKII